MARAESGGPPVRQIARYEVWQEPGRPTRFAHLFVFRDAAAHRAHGASAAVERFASILYPVCLAPVEFVEYTQVAAKTEPAAR